MATDDKAIEPNEGDSQPTAAAPFESLTCAQLRLVCDPTSLPFETTNDVEPVLGVIGQDSALEALQFGLEINAQGQNIFVRGLAGSGRMTLIRRVLENTRLSCPLARDRCYVHNFADPDRPRLITLGRREARSFKRRVDDLADFIRDGLATALNAEPFAARGKAIEEESKSKIDALIEPFEESLKEGGLALVAFQAGNTSHAALFPLIEGKPVPPEQWEQLRESGKVSDEEAKKFRKKAEQYEGRLKEVMGQVNEVRQKHAEQVRELREQSIRGILREYVGRIRERFSGEDVDCFLKELVEDVATDRGGEDSDADGDTRRYRVHVLLTHEEKDDCPIVVENTPSVGNLLGKIDRQFSQTGASRSDHHMIRCGSILRADGGYLILEAREVLRDPGAWMVLVRTLRTGQLEIVPHELTMPWFGPTLKPEPIDINVKVVLLGDAEIYYLLDQYDPDFDYLFKVLADFDHSIPRDETGITQYAGVLARITKEEGLHPFDREGVAALIEQGARIAGQQDRLSTRFGRLADIAREASYLADKDSRQLATGADVRSAVRRTKNRADLPSRKFREYLFDGTIRIQTKGKAVGQINGLAVTRAGQLTYGFPARITATIAPGSAGVINIERESALSGALHTKGFYILGGLLRHLLRPHHPLAFNASIAFEQSYGGIDGDSASSAEICCLLSALTEIPLRQDLAITGAIDQVGNIMAVGATNEKVEGFYDICNDLGLTGTQGVIIPKSNARDMMLRYDVVEACGAGRFHVYAVDNVSEALEVLTGYKAGTRNANGLYPEDSVLGIAVTRAFEYWVKAQQQLQMFSGSEGDDGDSGDGDEELPSPGDPDPRIPE